MKAIAAIQCSLKTPRWLAGDDDGAGHMTFDFDRTQAAEVLRLWPYGGKIITLVAFEGVVDKDKVGAK